MKKGKDFESFLSDQLHSEGIPIILSPLLLRRMNCGQIDIARIQELRQSQPNATGLYSSG